MDLTGRKSIGVEAIHMQEAQAEGKLHALLTKRRYNFRMPQSTLAEREFENAPPAFRKDPRWHLVERIVASPHLVKSSRLSSFLQFIAAETLAGREDLLNEQRIGVSVFERRVDYDSAEDNIVRSHASRLRQRLEAYFLDEGKAEPIRLVLRRGSYIPQFEPVAKEAVVTAPLSAELPVRVASHTAFQTGPDTPIVVPIISRSSNRIVWLLSAALVVSSCFAAYELRSNRNLIASQRSQSPVMRALWTKIFAPDKRTLIVAADSTLVLYEDLMGRQVDLHAYMNKSYLEGDPVFPQHDRREIANMIAQHRLTSVADLEMTARLLHIPEAMSNPPEIRFARDLQLADLKESNVIIIGASPADPWLSAFDSQLDFDIAGGMSSTMIGARVTNRSPRAGEQSEYSISRTDPGHKAYAVVALTQNLGGNGMVLVVAGTSIAGTEAASEFVTDAQQINSVLGPLLRQYGKIPSFEILLETTDFNGTAPQAKVLATHVKP